MRKVLWMVIYIPIITFAQSENGVQFAKDLNWREALTRARTENKYVFMDVYASWCGPCKLMDQNIYANDAVSQYVNKNFLSLKVQMDSTGQDNQQIKNWYADAHAINTKYNIRGYPSFLFFTPDGELVYRGAGYHDAASFLRMASFSLDPVRKDYYIQIANYKKGEKDYAVMMALVRVARDLLNDTTLANTIAADYKMHFLDKLSPSEICNEQNLEFIKENYMLVNSKDNFFYLFYNEPKHVDSVLKDDGVSGQFVDYIISKEEIQGKLWRGKKLITEKPDWAEIYSSISTKYNKEKAEKLVPQARLAFYKRIKNWEEFVKLREEQINKHPPKPNTSTNALLQDAWGLNIDAWELFLYCTNKSLLATALKWSDLSIRLYPSAAEQLQCIDTKANLLYKLGRIKEAIKLEEKTVLMASDEELKNGSKKGAISNNYANTLYKMENGRPTWSVK